MKNHYIAKNILLVVFFIITASFNTITFAADIHAELDRTQISMGDSFHLIFTIDNTTPAESPELGALLRDFQILAKSQSTNVSVVNGKATTETQWIITLLPKHTGNIEIPAIPFGHSKTQPLKIQVSNVKKNDSTKGAPIFLFTSVSNKTPYAQSEVLYTVQLYYATRIDTGTLSAPETSDAVITRLDPEKNYQAEHEGKLYQVVERHYTIYPDKSGHITITPPTFNGIIQDQGHYFSNRSDMFNTGLGQPVRLSGDTIELDVKPIPKEAAGSAWLPTTSLTLKETWSLPSELHVGDPITRTVEMKAIGLPAEQLPSLPSTKIPDVNSYDDKPVTDNFLGEEHIVGHRTEKIAYIPTQAGKIVLPEIVIPWWDTASNQMKYAKLPEKTLTILPSKTSDTKNAETQNQSINTAPESSPSKQPTQNKEPEKLTTNNIWPWLAGMLFLIWILTLSLWWYQRRRKNSLVSETASKENSQTPVTINQIKSSLKKACLSNDTEQTKTYLLQWAISKWPKENPKHLSAIMHLIPDTTLAYEMEKLDHAIYAEENQDWLGETLWDAFLAFEKQKKTKSHSENSNPLPPLYPE